MRSPFGLPVALVLLVAVSCSAEVQTTSLTCFSGSVVEVPLNEESYANNRQAYCPDDDASFRPEPDQRTAASSTQAEDDRAAAVRLTLEQEGYSSLAMRYSDLEIGDFAELFCAVEAETASDAETVSALLDANSPESGLSNDEVLALAAATIGVFC